MVLPIVAALMALGVIYALVTGQLLQVDGSVGFAAVFIGVFGLAFAWYADVLIAERRRARKMMENYPPEK
jgi:hypothetical protein